MVEHNPFNPATQIIVRRTPVDAHAHLLTAGRAKRYMRECGFRHLACEYFLYLPEKLYGKAGFLESSLDRVPLGGQFAIFAEKPAAGSV